MAALNFEWSSRCLTISRSTPPAVRCFSASAANARAGLIADHAIEIMSWIDKERVRPAIEWDIVSSRIQIQRNRWPLVNEHASN